MRLHNSIRVLSPEDMYRIHVATLEILENVIVTV